MFSTHFEYVVRSALTTLGAVVVLYLVFSLYKLIAWRLYFRKLQAQGLPMLPHSLLAGHLPVIVHMLGAMPSDAHPALVPDLIQRHYPELGPNYYLDLAPFAPSMLVVGSTELHQQIAQEHPLPKMPNLRSFLYPLTQGQDLVNMEGATWKRWRAVFSPGFSAAHLMTLVPAIVKEAQTFCGILDDHAEKHDIFTMKDLTDFLTLDVIGQVVLGTHFDCQRTPNRMTTSLRTLIRWLSFGLESNPFDRYNPWRYCMHWYHGRIIDRYISEELNARVESLKDVIQGEKSFGRPQTIMDLTIKAYTSVRADITREFSSMDPHFRRICISQIKLFLFAGHDTTSSALCWHFYLLSQHPDFLARIREEHNSVFGPDLNSAPAKIAQSPHLLNQLPLTTALIKESMRLFPVATITRRGERGFSVTDDEGRVFPTGGFHVFLHTHCIHHSTMYWPRVDEFLPERWLVQPGHPLYPVKGAWRSFEHGPRACMGQELAMLEMKVVLVLVARAFDFEPAYAEIDKSIGRKPPQLEGKRVYQSNIYQPVDDLLVRVSKEAV